MAVMTDEIVCCCCVCENLFVSKTFEIMCRECDLDEEREPIDARQIATSILLSNEV